MSVINRSAVQARDGRFVNGITKRFDAKKTLAIAGKEYTAEELANRFQKRLDAADAVATAEAALQRTRKEFREVTADLVPIVGGFRQQVRNIVGNDPEALADFGLAPLKTTRLDPETKRKAAELGKATRKARHTLGKRQREAIKGSVSEPEKPPV